MSQHPTTTVAVPPLRKSFTPDGLQFAWDSTSIQLAEECLYKYKLTILDGWEHRNKSVHLLFGGWYAKGLEHYHKYRSSGLGHDDAQVEMVREALEWTWIDGRPWESDHSTKTRETLLRSLVWYTEHFLEDSMELYILANGEPAVELSFRLPVDDDIILCGHIDRLVSYGGDLYVQDQKTTGSTITPRFFDGFSPDTQMSQYTLAGKAIYHVPVKGVVVDAAQIAVGFTRFERGFIHRTAAQLDEYLERAKWYINLAREATREGYFPMNTKSCGNYGGCPFRTVCAQSPQSRLQFLKGDFDQTRAWDPLVPR